METDSFKISVALNTNSKQLLKVIKKVGPSVNHEFSSPTSDFHLEKEGNIKSFFEPSLPEGFDLYDKKQSASTDKFSMIGRTSQAPKTAAARQRGWKRLTGKTSRITLKVEENSFMSRLKKPEDTKPVEEKLPLRIPTAKEAKMNDKHSKAQSDWNVIQRNLMKRTQKDASDLMANRSTQYKDKLLEIKKLQAISDDLNKDWVNIWYMTLREDPKMEKLTEFLPVGNRLSGIYATNTERRPPSMSFRRKFQDAFLTPRVSIGRSSRLSIETATPRISSVNYYHAESVEKLF